LKKEVMEMDALKTASVAVAAVGLVFLLAIVAGGQSGGGDLQKGEALFNDPTAFGGQRACSYCHPGGKGLMEAGTKSEFHVMGGTQHSLEEAVNLCIEYASKGKPVDPGSDKMKDIVAYIRSLSKK
jgi:mono/diheme cytochrome c family protein